MASSPNSQHSSGTHHQIIEILHKKRHGNELTRAEIEHFVHAYTRGEIPDYQASALLMASVLRGLTRAETAYLTEAMLASGHRMDHSHLPGRKVDKHSTGGVGDKTSFVVAPIAAAAGLYVPMNSGRGLGHTGGTLDKLESIPGFRVGLSVKELQSVLERCGCGMVSQTLEIAPADRKLYQLRHFTATIDHPSLICASIMSKKLAEGIDALVLDVKTGSGAFMRDEADSNFLAELMVETGKRMGVKTVALVTDMDQPLGTHIGNALEVHEVIDILHGGGPADTRDLSIDLAAWMLFLCDAAPTLDKARERSLELIQNGAAFKHFRDMVVIQSGDVTVIDNPDLLARARYEKAVVAEKSGFVGSIDCRAFGLASVAVGGGREFADEAVDPAVGFVLHAKVGDAVQAGDPLYEIHYNSEERLHRAEALLQGAYVIADTQPKLQPLIRRVIQ